MLRINITKKDKIVDLQTRFTESNLDINLVAYLLFCLKTPVVYNLVKENLRQRLSQDDFEKLFLRSEEFGEIRDEFMGAMIMEQAKIPLVPKLGVVDGH